MVSLSCCGMLDCFVSLLRCCRRCCCSVAVPGPVWCSRGEAAARESAHYCFYVTYSTLFNGEGVRTEIHVDPTHRPVNRLNVHFGSRGIKESTDILFSVCTTLLKSFTAKKI